MGQRPKNHYYRLEGFPGGSVIKNLPASAGASVQSLGGEDALEEEMATHSGILCTEGGQRSLAGYGSWGHKESDSV